MIFSVSDNCSRYVQRYSRWSSHSGIFRLRIGKNVRRFAAFDFCEPHRHDGRFLNDRHAGRAHDFRDARFLVRLNVEEENVRLILRADRLELREQDLAAEIKIQQEKSAQAQRKRQQEGAIVRAIEIRQALPQDEAPAVREEFPDTGDQQLRDAR